MRYSSRFFLYAPLGVFLVLFAIAGWHWWSMALALSDRLAAVNGREVMPGVKMQFAAKRISGFPFSLDTQLQNVIFTVASPHGPVRWRSEKFAMHGLTYGRDETIFEAAGHQTLQWTRLDGSERTLNFAVGSLRASAILNHGALGRFDLDLIGFGSNAFTAQRLQFHMRRNGDLQILSTMNGAKTPVGTCSLLDKGVDRLELRATITKPAPLTPLLSGAEAWASAVSHWRAAGGRVDGPRISSTRRNDQIIALESRLATLRLEDLLGMGKLTDAVCGQIH